MRQRGVHGVAGSNDGKDITVSLREKTWVGVDIGKAHRWVSTLDADGTRLLSVRIANDES